MVLRNYEIYLKLSTLKSLSYIIEEYLEIQENVYNMLNEKKKAKICKAES